MLQAMSNWRGRILSFMAGALLPLAFSPVDLYPLAVLSLTILFYYWNKAETPKQAAMLGWLFGLGMFGVGVSWVFVAIYVFGGSGMIVSSLLTFLFVAFLASYVAGLGWLIKKLSPVTSACTLWCLYPVAWLSFEAFKGWFLSGFPWLELGVSQIDGPLAGYIPIIGVLGVSLLVALSASLLLIIIKKHSPTAVVALSLIWVSGIGLQSVEWTQPVAEPIKVTMIQGNVPQEIKWDPKQLLNTLDLYKNLTDQHWDSDVVVWPENAIPAFYHQLKAFYLEPLQEQALATDTELLIGLPVLDEKTNLYYNSILRLGEQPGFYHKQHLVPFGDYVPFDWLRGLLSFFQLPMSSFSAGPSGQELLTVAGQPVASTVCYEDVFSSEVLQALPQATLLFNATNNAWYGDSFAPHQHLQISRSRALETERPLVRVTTNGISAFVDFKGQIQQQTPQFQLAKITAEVQPREGATPYINWHYWPIIIISVFMLLVWGYYRQELLDSDEVCKF